MTLWRINVAEWSAEQVVDWLKGLDNSMYHYVNSFTNNEVGGQELLSIRPYILEQLGMYSISHQEIVLEAVRLLRNFHYNLDKENLQYLALQVASQAWSLHKQVSYCKDKNVIETNILKEVTSTVATIKPLIGWLDRTPFQGQRQFNEIRTQMLRLALEMATSAHRDRFADEPVNQIQTNAEKLAKLADYIIQDITDPMLLQPASLLLVTLKKKESDLGISLMPDVHGVHKIFEIRHKGPADLSGKVEVGDEIVQINYQTIVGWQHKKVLLQLHESKPDVLLTLKKRPKHMKIYGQIYMKPYRLPSKKRAMHYRWGETLPSPRAELLSINDLPLPVSRPLEKHVSDSDSDSNGSDILTPTEPKAPNTDLPLFLQKPRPVLQRRNTICGDQTSSLKNLGNMVFWQERKDKSVSFGHGLEITPRPNTFIALKGSLPEIMSDKCGEERVERREEKQDDIEKSEDDARRSGVSKVVRFDADLEEFDSENNCVFNVDNTVIETFEPIPYADEDILTSLDCGNIEHSHMATKMTPETGVVQAINTALINSREGRKTLDVCDSSDDDVPPAIEPRKEFLQTTPPEPPPRPKKTLEAAGGFIRPASGAKPPVDDVKSKVATVVDLKSKEACQSVAEVVNQHRRQPSPPPKLPTMRHFREEPFEALELFTPPKTKGLTLKKKNSILAKRRRVTLKCLTVSDIQGHLYRRTKDKSGAAYWAKGYFVLVDTALYGFKTKDAIKANCLIFLSGFTVSLANEVHSKANAFKVYHTSKTFYFAAETPEALSQWMEFIRNATLKGNPAIGLNTEVDLKEIFTETDTSDDDSDLLTRGTFSYGGSTSNVMTSSLGKVSQEGESTPVTTTKQEKYHLGFGSLKKFTKSTLPFTKGGEKKSSPDIPTPTAQFRSYRKVINPDVRVESKPVLEVPQIKAPPVPTERSEEVVSTLMTKKARRPAPLNYIHASNPNLVDFDFHTSKTIDFSVPKINNTWEGQHSLQGFMTLKDLMLQKQAEDAKEVYNNRVFLGMEKKEERGVRKKIRKNSRDVEGVGKVHENPKIDKIQSRSLPKTPDYAQSFKPDDVDIIMTRSKEGLKLRDFGYEFISGDDPQDGKLKADQEKTWPKRSDKVSPTVTSWSKKKGNWIISTEKRVDEEKNRSGSFKKFKPGKFDNILTTSDKMFSFKHTGETPKTPLKPLEKYAVLKPVSSYSPVTFPHGKKSNLQVRNDLKENLSHSLSDASVRKSSVERSASYFQKLSFSNTKTPKEKKLLGSPRLHRALFGRQNSTEANSIFETITFPATTSTNSPQEPPALFPRTPVAAQANPGTQSGATSPDYPHLEYPPVFEPETYSLSDPSTSLTLLRRRNNKNK